MSSKNTLNFRVFLWVTCKELKSHQNKSCSWPHRCKAKHPQSVLSTTGTFHSWNPELKSSSSNKLKSDLFQCFVWLLQHLSYARFGCSVSGTTLACLHALYNTCAHRYKLNVSKYWHSPVDATWSTSLMGGWGIIQRQSNRALIRKKLQNTTMRTKIFLTHWKQKTKSPLHTLHL